MKFTKTIKISCTDNLCYTNEPVEFDTVCKSSVYIKVQLFILSVYSWYNFQGDHGNI